MIDTPVPGDDTPEFYRQRAAQARDLASVSLDQDTVDMLTAEAEDLDDAADHLERAKAAAEEASKAELPATLPAGGGQGVNERS